MCRLWREAVLGRWVAAQIPRFVCGRNCRVCQPPAIACSDLSETPSLRPSVSAPSPAPHTRQRVRPKPREGGVQFVVKGGLPDADVYRNLKSFPSLMASAKFAHFHQGRSEHLACLLFISLCVPPSEGPSGTPTHSLAAHICNSCPYKFQNAREIEMAAQIA